MSDQKSIQHCREVQDAVRKVVWTWNGAHRGSGLAAGGNIRVSRILQRGLPRAWLHHARCWRPPAPCRLLTAQSSVLRMVIRRRRSLLPLISWRMSTTCGSSCPRKLNRSLSTHFTVLLVSLAFFRSLSSAPNTKNPLPPLGLFLPVLRLKACSPASFSTSWT